MSEMWKQHFEVECRTVVEMCECEWWKLYKNDVSLKELLRQYFPLKRPVHQDHLLNKIKSVALFGYVQSDINVPEQLSKFVIKEAISIPSVVAEIRKLLANSSFGWQFMDRSRLSVTRYMREEKHVQ